MSINVNIANVPKVMDKGWVNIGGTSKVIDKLYCNVNGLAKEGFASSFIIYDGINYKATWGQLSQLGGFYVENIDGMTTSLKAIDLTPGDDNYTCSASFICATEDFDTTKINTIYIDADFTCNQGHCDFSLMYSKDGCSCMCKENNSTFARQTISFDVSGVKGLFKIGINMGVYNNAYQPTGYGIGHIYKIWGV